MNDNEKQFFRIAVILPVRETFSYSVPYKLTSRARVGCRVLVPFRNRKVIGYILKKENGLLDKTEGIRDILDVLDLAPLFPPSLVPFFQWVADYYLYPIGRLIQSALPGGMNETHFKSGQLTEKGEEALNLSKASDEEKKILKWIKDNPGKRLISPFNTLYNLQRKGWVFIENRKSKRSVGPLRRKFIRLKDQVDIDSVLNDQRSSTKAKNVIEFLEALAGSNGLALSRIYSMFSNGPYLVKKWINAGIIESYSEIVIRDPAGRILSPSPEPPYLFEQQKEVLNTLLKQLDKGHFSTFLLYGVTGSGKTEVYYRAVKHTLGLNRQAILMVPEIALAIYMESVFRSRLGKRVAIFHSALSRGERYDQWMRILRGEVDLVIGARSALFAPLSRLGLIIVDEEYDSSYKQEEGPRYQARDAAVVRGKMEKALVILGSATPSVQSFYNSVKGRYHLVSMPERIEERPLPEVEIVDMKTVFEKRKGEEFLSPALREALDQNLAKGKQAILFLNRRGFGRVYLCGSCGEPVRCLNCDLTLTYHLKENSLICHYCGFDSRPRLRCSSCGLEGMKAYGFGTERMEQELKAIFPKAHIARLDRDSTRRKGETFKILKQFNEHKTDILVGTQMITKGYDFPNVTLVGVIAADLSLGFPDFRAGERTFQILSQVAGRSGRGDQRGKVIIQTFNPDHYAIMTAKSHDYEAFFNKERELREQLGYPPFSYLACLRFQGNNRKNTAEIAQEIGTEIKTILKKWPKRGKEIQVLGPAEAPLAKLKGKYRWQMLLKSKGTQILHYLLKEVEGLSKNVLRKNGVNMIIDVDPYQML